MNNKDEMVQSLYDSVAETYANSVKRTNYIGPQWLLENLQPYFQANGLRVLDLGCANGINVANLKKICAEGSHFYASFQRFESDNPAAPRRMKSGAVTHFAYSTKEILAKLNQVDFQVVSVEELIGYTGGAPCPYTFIVAKKKTQV